MEKQLTVRPTSHAHEQAPVKMFRGCQRATFIRSLSLKPCLCHVHFSTTRFLHVTHFWHLLSLKQNIQHYRDLLTSFNLSEIDKQTARTRVRHSISSDDKTMLKFTEPGCTSGLIIHYDSGLASPLHHSTELGFTVDSINYAAKNMSVLVAVLFIIETIGRLVFLVCSALLRIFCLRTFFPYSLVIAFVAEYFVHERQSIEEGKEKR